MTAIWTAAAKLKELRSLMNSCNVDGYFVPSEDSHQSEYPVEADRRREYISGFTGSAGYVLITKEHAYLWTDGRYFLQAEAQLDSENWNLCKQLTPGCPLLTDVLKHEVKRLGVDPFVLSEKWIKDVAACVAQTTAIIPIHNGTKVSEGEKSPYPARPLCSKCKCVSGIDMGQRNLIDEVWNKEGTKPPYPSKTIVNFPNCGATWQEKVKLVTEQIGENEVLVLANLSQIAWFLNLRGADVDCSRIFLAYCIVTKCSESPNGGRVALYLKNKSESNRLCEDAIASLSSETIKDYDQLLPDMKNLMKKETKVFVDCDVNVGLLWAAQCCSDNVTVAQSPIYALKAVKNPVEVEGMRQAHIEDGFALSMGLCWLYTLQSFEGVTECLVADKLRAIRSTRPEYKCLSFDSIVGVDDNSAVIHYRPEEGTCKPVNPCGLLLIDSGAHYTTGTTDVTRTFHLGEPTEFQREMYTRVLMGHLDLAAAVFPDRTHGCMLDCLARKYLWQIGFNYLHGTGHGVGHSLEVHEAPPNIAYGCPPSVRDQHLKPGMIVSNEPGAYIDGAFGIRIESLLCCKRVHAPFHFNQPEPYLGFDTLTLVPHCKKLIKKSLMTPAQIEQLNAYHNRVYTILSTMAHHPDNCWEEKNPLKISKECFLSWLKEACKPL